MKRSNTQTIELTSKRLKVQLALSVIAVVITLPTSLVITAQAKSNPRAVLAGLALLVASMIWVITTKIRIWWHHG